MGRTGERASWVSFDGPSSGLLPYSGGSGTKTFDFKVNPDDSENAGSSLMQSPFKPKMVIL